MLFRSGAFSEHYSQKPELLSIVFPVILLHGLSHPDTAMYATRALKDICKDNMTHIGTYSEGILNVCHHKLLEGSMVVSYTTSSYFVHHQ